MKSCPTCNRTFEDTFTFCLIDGSVLSAPIDTHATLAIPEARQTELPPTEVLTLEERKQEIPPTIASPQAEQKPEGLASTIVSPAPPFDSPKSNTSPAQPIRKSSRSPLIMISVGVLMIVGLIIFIFFNRANSTNENVANTNAATRNIAPPAGNNVQPDDNVANQLKEYQSKLQQLEQQRTKLLATYTPEWPEVKKLDEEISDLEKKIQALQTRASPRR